MQTTPGKRCCREFETDQRDKSLLTIRCQPPKGLVFDPKEFLAVRRPTRNKLAFDKCTLLSSQGTDAPTETISRPTRGAVHINIGPFEPSSSHRGTQQDQRRENRPNDRSKTIHHPARSCAVRHLRRSGAFRPLRSPLWGEQVITYVPTTHPSNPHHTPGVSHP